MKKIFELIRNKYEIFLLIFAIIFGFIFRIYYLNKNNSFWVDEASTARFGRAVLETGIPKTNGYFLDAYFVTHYLTGFSFIIFGQNEFAARLPEVIFGTLLIYAVYFFGKNIFNSNVGVASGLFISFSYIQIAWSRQARGYTILEFFFILFLAFFYLSLSQNKNIYYKILATLCLVLTIFTHTLGLSLIIISILYLLLRSGIINIKIKPIIVLLLFISLVLAVFPIGKTLYKYLLNEALPNLLNGKNHISYYHSLFWRNYPLFVFLSVIGLILLWQRRENKLLLFFLIILFVYIGIAVFLLFVPFEKYVLVLFPIIFTLSSYSIYEITKSLFKKDKSILIFYFIVIFIIFNGNKFSLKPKSYYSLNFDMKEIPEIDYKKYYGIVKEKANIVGYEKMAIIDIDEDIPAWYLGENKHYFNPRNDVKDKVKSNSVGAIYVHNLKELENIRKEYDYGFIFLIEHNFRFYPEGVVDYARKNLKLEGKESVASFSPDWNYWPVELYSWGFNESNSNK